MSHFLRRWAILFLLAILLGGLGFWWDWTHQTNAALLRQAETALSERQYDQARDLLTRYLAVRPDDPRARLLAARSARWLKSYYEARQHLRHYRQAGGDEEPAAVEESLIQLQRGTLTNVPWLRQRAKQGDDLALAALEVLVQHDLKHYDLWAALDGLNEYLTHRPNDLHALLARGYVWERVLYFKDAVRDYRTAVLAHPDNEPARLRLAEALLVVGPPSEALEQFQWVADRQPTALPPRFGLARAHRQLGNLADARPLLDDILSQNPDHGEALWERGQLALDERQPTQAEPFLRRATQQLPFDRRPHYSLYRCLLSLGRDEEARTVNQRVEQLDHDLRQLTTIRNQVMRDPTNAALRCQGGLLFLRNGEREEGLRWLQTALRLDPTCEPARKALVEADSYP